MRRTTTRDGSGMLGTTALGCGLAVTLLAAAGCEQPREITEATGEMKVVVDGNNEFALDLYGVAAAEPGNLFFSPFSITTALSMVYAGAEADTETQIGDGMYVGDEDAWHANLGALVDDLSGQHHRPYTLFSANQVWGQDGYPIRDDYLDVMEGDYLAPMEILDFQSDPAGARKEINGWVDNQTKGHIEELFREADIVSDTKLVLANAIYFKADWEHKFPKNESYDGGFTLPDGTDITTNMMTIDEEHFPYAETDAVQVLEMPYKGEELGMVVVLPREVDGLADVEATLTREQLDGWIDAMDEPEVVVHFPSFEMHHELPLMETLQALGMTDMFDRALADFTGIVEREDMNDNLFVNAARHKAYVKVDEEGTEAAAATGFGMTDLAAEMNIEFVADHPFLFLIRDRLTGAILFAGRVEDPR